MLPGDLPPWQTVYRYFARWRRDGTLDRLHDALREQVRTEEEGPAQHPRLARALAPPAPLQGLSSRSG